MTSCPACRAPVPDGTERCPACRIPFTVVGASLAPSATRAARPMIPSPPVVSGAPLEPPPMLAIHRPPQPTPTPPPPPVEQQSHPAYGVVSSYLPEPAAAEPTPWWRSRLALIAGPVALVALLATLLAATGNPPEAVQVRVPAVTGMDVLDAKNLIDAQGLVTPFAGYGKVASQNPPGGALVAPGTVVVLTIDRYPDPPAATKAPTPRVSRNPASPTS